MNNLEIWRKQIDILDEKLLKILSLRMKIVKKIGKYKKDNNKLIIDEKRWETVIKNNLKKGEKLNLSGEFIQKLLNLIHIYSQKVQDEKS